MAKVGDISRVARSGNSHLASADHYVDEADLARLGTKPIPKGSVLFAKIGEAIKQNHRVIAARDLLIDNNAIAAVPGPDVTGDYLYQFLRTIDLYGLASTTAVPSLRKSDLARITLPLPSLQQQARIAGILGSADALRAKRRAAIAQLDALARSIFIDMVGGGCSHLWPETTVASIADPAPGSIRTGPFGSQLLHSEFVDEGVAVLGIDNAVHNEFRWAGRRYVSPAKYKELKRYTVKPGDVLITIMGTCGRCAVVPDDIPAAINTKHLCCITLDKRKCLPEFLHAYFLWHPTARAHLERRAKGAIMSGLNMGIIKALPVRLPPLYLQGQFARRLRAVRCLTTANGSSLLRLDELFSSLQHRAFRGEL